MKAMPIGSRHENHDFQTAQAFVLEIKGVWYRLEYRISPVFNPREEQYSDNVLRWTTRGNVEIFDLTPCEPPQQALPPSIQKFLDRHIETGCKEASFVMLHEGVVARPGEKEGWQQQE